MSNTDNKEFRTGGIRIEVGSTPITAPDHLEPINCSKCDHSYSKHTFNPCSGIKNNGDHCDCPKFQ